MKLNMLCAQCRRTVVLLEARYAVGLTTATRYKCTPHAALSSAATVQDRGATRCAQSAFRQRRHCCSCYGCRSPSVPALIGTQQCAAARPQSFAPRPCGPTQLALIPVPLLNKLKYLYIGLVTIN